MKSSSHNNSSGSKSAQHTYNIWDSETNKIVKTGISSDPLNGDGSSPRANSQVNAANKAVGWNKYLPEVLKGNIPGRARALAEELANWTRQVNNGWVDKTAVKPKGMKGGGKKWHYKPK